MTVAGVVHVLQLVWIENRFSVRRPCRSCLWLSSIANRNCSVSFKQCLLN